MIVMVLLACGGPAAPSLAPLAAKVARYEEGRRQLDAGDAEAALLSFEAAQGDGDDPLLATWVAYAEARRGRDDRAAAVLQEVLDARPGFKEARFNLGCALARLGRHDEAAREVGLAILAGQVRPREAARDPAIAPHLALPAWDLLPDSPLGASLSAAGGLAYLGSEVPVSLVVSGVEDGPVDVGVVAAGPAALVSVVEDRGVDERGDRAASLVWTLAVRASGEVVVGPAEVRSGSWTATAPAVRFPTSAPGGAAVSSDPVPLPSLSRLVEGHAAPSVWQEGTAWVAAVSPGARVDSDPAPTWRGSLREAGAPVVDVLGFPARPARLVVRGGTAAAWTWSPEGAGEG